MANVDTNISDVNERLENLVAAASGRQLETAVHAGLLPIETLAKVIVAKVTGTLARSIHIEVQSGGGAVYGRCGTNVDYATVQELRPGKAYMRPAFDAGRGEVVDEIRDALKTIIRKAVNE